MEVCNPDTQFLLQFAANGFLRAFTFLDAAAWRAVKDNSRKGISDFSHQESVLAAQYTQGRLPCLDFHPCVQNNDIYRSAMDLGSEKREAVAESARISTIDQNADVQM
jgi:hypothetical protein